MLKFFKEWYPLIPADKLQYVLSVLDKELLYSKICPKQENVFRAFLECPYDKLKVVMVGQDPYPQKDIATGILFANNRDTVPENYSPSLKVFVDSINMYYYDIPSGEFSPELTYLCHQGVLMLNSALTVRLNQVGSHTILWRSFTSTLLSNIFKNKPDTIFILFGNQAQSFEPYLKGSKNMIKCPHPAYCARNNKLLPDIFSETDRLLETKGLFPIYWK